MRFVSLSPPARHFALVCATLVIASCSSGSGSRSSQGDDRASEPFAIETVSVIEGATWQINRAIEIAFNHRVDASSVNANTIYIADVSGASAVGDYEVFGRTVRFQPACPTEDDFSDAGLLPGTDYTLHVLGSTTGGVTVRDERGEGLEVGRVVAFSTPDSSDPLALFLDTVPGPPSVVLRPQGNTDEDFPGVRLAASETTSATTGWATSFAARRWSAWTAKPAAAAVRTAPAPSPKPSVPRAARSDPIHSRILSTTTTSSVR
ncbi:MAG: Ig-like domain-containing protein [bacterium]|nr:Ig-like domain-containing protein [bacterium]